YVTDEQRSRRPIFHRNPPGRRSVGCFSWRERNAHICFIRVERATRKKQPTGRGPEGCDENGPAAALLVGYVSI
ncbi:MAG TPA: hypothetical protein VE242_11660, partial [Chthoniobacterales bacterium]|nr:hypothetical protein [Chthoniobacterales bacterium]